ncbi:hypothetical protein SAMN05444166_5969 [Singulisphaera sp. GP187]|uniref:hypothetical protein n=1 Tax=Singulisphaera sp. GP187 TaxID=1882752 RepID=UPI00092C4202|nr:hypothetical protein [Singulisphaera sp. GP187]SIO59223.1 hypothetical protein SAMN05444166_5969 [Singulisphaera sp. GP187]
MSVEPVVDVPAPDERSLQQRQMTELWAWALVLTVAAGFILVGGGRQDLGPIEARLGIAAGEPFGPLGFTFGGWEPSLWPGEVVPSQLWGWGEEGRITSASVRWPAAIAGLLAGLILTRRVMATLGMRAAILTMLCWSGSVALMDRSAGTGLALISGLAIVATLDRILGRGSGWVAGLWAALAFLCGGWPPLALIGLATIVLGRRETGLSVGLLVPPILAAVAWSVWALNVMSTEAWAAALALPLTQKTAWFLPVTVFALGLPWSPFVALVASRSVRDGWSAPGRLLIMGWLQVAGACVLAGTVVPGLALAAGLPALAGLAVVAAACCDRFWSGTVSAVTHRRALGLAVTIALLWIVPIVVGGIYLGSAVSYYRGLAILLIVLAVPVAGLCYKAVTLSDPRRALIMVALVTVCLKFAHMGYYAPEWNYRRSQGPWGRAIGQWIPPNWPVYITHAWSPDLAFSIGRPVRQLASPKLLTFLKDKPTNHVLLLDSEFENWPADAPALVKVASFQDEYGGTRVLARTAGEFSWRIARQSPVK